MLAQEIRDAFTRYFEDKGHHKQKSSSLIPHNDPTLLFANAGMNQFKDFFTGKATSPEARVVTIQKCVRAGGKHNDLENVGFTARHHTFFEMLGNFSFGDYFKKEAISYAWDFLVNELKIPEEKLLITVHDSDDEAYRIWSDEIGVPQNKIFKLGDKSNFWEMGEIGPCGPCSEIFYDHGPEMSSGVPSGHQEIDDEGRYVEIWNLVFMQYEKYEAGNTIKRRALPKPCVDTGSGLERVAAVIQGKYYNYDTDLFRPIMTMIGNLCSEDYYSTKSNEVRSSFRVIADHIRSCTMLITDGAIPSNEGRGYVLRRIIRRAIRHLSLLGIKETSFHKLVPAVFETLGKEYPDNAQNASLAEKLLKLEEEKFRKTLENGLALMNEELEKLPADKKFSGEIAFKLYDTFGFPLDLTEVILREKNIQLDIKSFNEAMERQKEQSKKGSKFKVEENNLPLFYSIKEKYGETVFTGYDETKTKAKLIAREETDGKFSLVFDKTPFYGESGGQLGDKGEILFHDKKVASITDTQKPVEGLHIHLSSDAGDLTVGQEYTLQVNEKERELIKRNHSATHLLQAALINVLGDHVKQAGSSVGPDRLRFDFTHSEALKEDEIKRVEELVNLAVINNFPVTISHMSKEEATQKGAMALFGEKYGDEVRVLEMGDFSIELCGGTHVNNTGEIGLFKIISETALASGIRRIEALTSSTAMNYLLKRSRILGEVEKLFSVKEEKVLTKISSLQLEMKDKIKEIEKLNDKIQHFESQNIFNNKIPVRDDFSLVLCKISSFDQARVRKLGDIFVDKYPKGILFLYALNDEKVSFILKTHKTNKNINCSSILKEVMPIINGRGGGKADNAQGSGDSEHLEALIKAIEKVLT